MNRFGQMAMTHWRRFAPTRYGRILDPTAFFTRLGIEVEQEISAMTEQILGSTPSTEDYLRNLARYTEARRTAESEIVREMVLIPAEAGSPLDEESRDSGTMADGTLHGEWMPVTEHHPT